jgi:hypothetical protein
MPRNKSCDAVGLSLYEQLGDIVSYVSARIVRIRPDTDTSQLRLKGLDAQAISIGSLHRKTTRSALVDDSPT